MSGTEYVELGSQIQLMCNATGKPQPPHDVEWFKDGEKINSNAQTGILITKKIETKVLISVLVIKHSKIDDNGFYICRSSNKDVGTIKVHVLNGEYQKHSLQLSNRLVSVFNTSCAGKGILHAI